MTETVTPARTYWREALPVRADHSAVSPERLAGHFAAMAHAHLTEYGVKLIEGPQTPEALRRIVSDHFDPGAAAFAAAASLRGWTPEQILDAIADGQTMHECTWEWVADAIMQPDEVVDELMASLSTSALDATVKASRDATPDAR